MLPFARRGAGWIGVAVLVACGDSEDETVVRFGEVREGHLTEPAVDEGTGTAPDEARREAVAAWRDGAGGAPAIALARAYFPDLAAPGPAAGGPPRQADAALLVTLPADASAPVALKTRGLVFEVTRLEVAGPFRHLAGASSSGDRRVLAPAGRTELHGEGGAWLADRVEDYDVVDEGSGTYRVPCRITLPDAVRTVRDADEYLELLGSDGAPVLRLHRPEARDAGGGIRIGTLALRGLTRREDALYRASRELTVEAEVPLDGLTGPVVVDPGFSATGSLATARYGHTATRLGNEKVIVVGGTGASGALASTELYEPASGTWSAGPTLATARTSHAAVTLADGRLLVVGGKGSTDLASAELYDPTANTWVPAGTLAAARREHSATRLANGKVLVAGGMQGANGYLTSAELFDPVVGTWSSTGGLVAGRRTHTATALPGNEVLVAAGKGVSGAPVGAELYDAATGRFAPAGSLVVGRDWATAALLPSGKVLVAGGYGYGTGRLDAAELYDPTAGTWTATGPMVSRHYLHAATQLADGRVMVVGGQFDDYTDETGVDVYDPTTGTWTATGGLAVGRRLHTATAIAGGKVLVVGGYRGYLNLLSSVELFDPAVGSWKATGSLVAGRSLHTATTLVDGTVLLAGGNDGATPMHTVERYDRATGTWTATGSLSTARQAHAAARLDDGRVLVTGGWSGWASGVLATAALYNPATGTWAVTDRMPAARQQHTATKLADGRVLVAGGTNDVDGDLASAAIYDPATGTWAPTGSLGSARARHTATLLANGHVLVVGGSDPYTAEVFDPVAGAWAYTATPTVGRTNHTATRLADGRVLVVGGDGYPRLASAELWDPASGTWAATGPLAFGRTRHSATLLANGKVLVAGGWGNSNLATAELFDPSTGTWSRTWSLLRSRASHSATLLADGCVLAAGGQYEDQTPIATAELLCDGPVRAASREVEVAEDGTVAITLDATSAAGGPLTYRIVSGPGHGTLTGTAPTLTYAPAPDYRGPDSFTFVATDAGTDSPPATVAITVTDTPDPPVAERQGVATDEDVPLAIVLAGDDADGDPLAFRVTSGPAHGTLSGTAPNLTYTPAANYGGADSFAFVATAAGEDSAPADVSITVRSVNDAPVAGAQSLVTAEDSTLVIALWATDADADALAFEVRADPAHGTLSGDGAARTYVPAPDYHGPDSFAFVAHDGTAYSAQATVSITVTAVNDAPVAAPASVATDEDVAVTIALQATDPDGDPLAFAIAPGPAHGTLTAGPSPGEYTYAPVANYHGPDTFAFTAGDPCSTFGGATVSIEVNPVNDPPLAVAPAAVTPEDTPLALTLAGTDVDGDPLRYRILARPLHGTLTGGGASWSYAPEANYAGPDSFTYVANDGTADSDAATVSITVAAVDDAPVAAAQDRTTAEDTPVSITLEASDVEGAALTFRRLTPPAHGTLSGTGASLAYTPEPDYFGPDSFTFAANDGAADSAPATVSIDVTAVDDAPVAIARSWTTDEDTPVLLTLAGTDVEGSALTFRAATLPGHGTVFGAGALVSYTPAPDYHGADSFSFVANDGATDSAPALLSITVHPVNDAPVLDAVTPSGERTVGEGEPIGFEVVATDVDGDALALSVSPVPASATFDPGTGAFRWTPGWPEAGVHVLTISAGDGSLADTRTLAVTVVALDADRDGLPDTWEEGVGLDGGSGDADGDFLSDRVEVGDDLASPRDTDADGTLDAADADSDDDGVPDALEAGDEDPATAAADTDGDGTPDYRDPDSDGDGVTDGLDRCRLVPDPEQRDLDGDGLGDACDPELDGDGLADALEEELGLAPDAADSDGDTIEDGVEVGDPADPFDTDHDGTLDAREEDSDADGLTDRAEAGDEDPATPPIDTDGDLLPNYRDLDSDDDGTGDGVDVCPLVADPDQADFDHDGLGDACDGDDDGDTFPDDVDLCPRRQDAEQVDQDGDGAGDGCDADDDDDGVPDLADNCPRRENAAQEDSDGDGTGDACDPTGDPEVTEHGCGCRTAGGTDAAGLLALGLALLLSRQRRR